MAVTWKNSIIVWGGIGWDEDPVGGTLARYDVVFFHLSEKWIMRDTNGDSPPKGSEDYTTTHAIRVHVFQ